MIFHHVGVVTRRPAESRRFYEGIGYAVTISCDDPVQKAAIVLLSRADGPTIELITPLAPESPASGWLKRMNAGPYHTCYEVRDLVAAVQTLKAEKFLPLGEPMPAVAFGGRHVVFLWGEHVGLLELLEQHAG